jgi:hypothetical protein
MNMATATPVRSGRNRADSDRRVRHPLQTLRGYIRWYVLLEGTAIALIYLALLFWGGLALDYGLFKATGGFDWIQELQGVGQEQSADMIVRGVILGMAVAGLLAVVALKVFFRLFREFRDPALALVLERRFPKELGDRVITAVEMAGPNVAENYGYSQALVDKTINDAADRVEKVPVRDVFDWRRLKKLGLIGLGLTLGLYLLAGLGYLGISGAVGAAVAPSDYFWRFNHTAGIWVERNILLMDSYWPRQAHLELVRFQEAPHHKGEMRVGRDEQRPDLQVRAFRWVVADRRAPGGWRPLKWNDLPEFVDSQVLQSVAVPEDWHGWIIDLDDLDERLPATVLPPRWQGLTSGGIRQDLAKPAVQAVLADAGATEAVHDLLNWKTWTLDKIALQHNHGEVRRRLRDFPQVNAALEAVFARVDELAQTASMERRLRKLQVPDDEAIQFVYWGKKTKNSTGPDVGRTKDNNFYFNLAELKESVRFTIRASDYSTPAKYINLVPPPAISSLTVDKEEPAYIYYRLQGDQAPLKGKKQIFRDVPVSITGESSTIQVPIGTNMTLTAKVDRPLKHAPRMNRPAQTEERGALLPDVPVRFLDDKQTFSVAFGNVLRPIEFEFEFVDLDNVKGRRRLLVRPIDDRAPDVFDVEMTAVLRKPRFKTETGKVAQTSAAEGFLVTPDAQVPFKGTLRDDYGLTQAEWLYEVEPVEFELIGRTTAGDKDKLPSLVLFGNTRVRRNGLIVSGMQFSPGVPGMAVTVPTYWAWLTGALANDLAYGGKSKEGTVPLERFLNRLEDRAAEELTLNALLEQLKQKPPHRGLFKEHLLKEEDGFDFKRYLPTLKVKDATKEAQLHYRVRLSVSATDNNVETGPGIGRNKAPFTYLVVSEMELLSQIFLEEEILRERLEKVVFKLKNARTFTNEQISKLSTPDFDLSLIALRVDEVRKALGDGASGTREIHADYARILRELEVNRVGWDRGKKKIEDVKTKIVEPLEDVVNPNNGNFTLADTAVAKLFEGLDVDVSRLRNAEEDKNLLEQTKLKLEANRPEHVKNAQDLRDRLDSLIDRLYSVLLAMDEGIAFGQLLQIAVALEREQRQAYERLLRFQRQQEAELIKGVLNPDSK